MPLKTKKASNRWTEITYKCYLRNCICDGCYYKSLFKNSVNNCHAKISVVDLIRKAGLPEELVNKHGIIL